jgi:hypothetical protein
MCTDERQSKLIVGDRRGNIGVYNFTTGVLLRRLCGHQRNNASGSGASASASGSSVDFLWYGATDKTIVSMGADGGVLVHDDSTLASLEDETGTTLVYERDTVISQASIQKRISITQKHTSQLEVIRYIFVLFLQCFWSKSNVTSRVFSLALFLRPLIDYISHIDHLIRAQGTHACAHHCRTDCGRRGALVRAGFCGLFSVGTVQDQTAQVWCQVQLADTAGIDFCFLFVLVLVLVLLCQGPQDHAAATAVAATRTARAPATRTSHAGAAGT